MEKLRRNILATLAYYDVFDWPLKAEEILAKLAKISSANLQLTPKESLCDPTGQAGYRVQGLNAERWTLNAIQIELDQLVLDRMVDFADSFYFLAGREHLVPLRLKREKIAKRKWRLARRAVWWLRFVPYIRAVFASGSLAMRNTDELSDLDVLIVVKHGRIWLARFLVLMLLSLLHMRRKAGDKIAPDKICPNHFITDKSLYVPFKSIYTAQTYANLVPIYVDRGALIEEFKKANNWVLGYVHQWNIGKVPSSPDLQSKSRILDFVKRNRDKFQVSSFSEWLLDISGLGRILEDWLGRYQSRRIARNPATQSHAAGHVVFDDGQLAFHPDSIEKEIINGYNARLIQLGLPDLLEKKMEVLLNEYPYHQCS